MKRAGGSQVEIGSCKLRVLPHRLSSPHALIPYDLCGRGTRFEEALFLDSPLVAKYLHVLRSELALGVVLLSLHCYRITSGPLQNDLIPDLRLGKRFRHGALNVPPPDLAYAVRCLESHKIGRFLIRVVPVRISAIIQEPAGDPLARLRGCRPWSLLRVQGRCRGRHCISGEGLDPLARRNEIPAERSNELTSFLLARLVAAHYQPGKSRLLPCLPPETLSVLFSRVTLVPVATGGPATLLAVRE